MTVREQMLHYKAMHLERAQARERGEPELPEPSPELHREYAGHYDRWVAELDRLTEALKRIDRYPPGDAYWARLVAWDALNTGHRKRGGHQRKALMVDRVSELREAERENVRRKNVVGTEAAWLKVPLDTLDALLDVVEAALKFEMGEATSADIYAALARLNEGSP